MSKIMIFQKIKNFLLKYKVIIQITISIIILIIIFQKIDFRVVISMLFELDLGLFIILLCISAIKLFTQVLNWSLCLKIFSPPYPLSTILKTHLIGLALRFIVPGGFGIFGKAFYINKELKQTVYSVVVEKFFIFWVICFFAGWAIIISPINFPLSIIHYPLSIIITISPLLLIFIFKELIKNSNYIKTFPKIMISQIVFEILTFTQYFLLLQFFLQIGLSFFDVSICIALILVANIIPITYSGLGLREAASALLLPKIGIPAEIAVGASLIIFLLNAVIPALPGVVFIAMHKKENDNTPHINTEASSGTTVEMPDDGEK